MGGAVGDKFSAEEQAVAVNAPDDLVAVGHVFQVPAQALALAPAVVEDFAASDLP